MLTLRQAAHATGMSTTTLRRYIKAGRLKARLIPGRYGPEYVVTEEELGAAGISLMEATAVPRLDSPEASPQTAPPEEVLPATAAPSPPSTGASTDAVPGMLYRELLMKHEHLLVQYGMLRVGGQQLYTVRQEAESRTAEAREAVKELEKLRDRHAREIGRLKTRHRHFELEIAKRDDEIRRLEQTVQRLEMMLRNAQRSARYDHELEAKTPSEQDASRDRPVLPSLEALRPRSAPAEH